MARSGTAALRRLRRLRREEDGQILPLLVVLLISLLAIGTMLFQVGRAADLRSRAQTAADAAALAAGENMEDQLRSQAGVSGGASIGAIDEGLMRAAAADYAQRNGGRLRSMERDGFEVAVTVDTEERLGAPAREIDEEAEETRGEAEAFAELEISSFGTIGGGNIGPIPGRGDGDISDEEWEELEEEIKKPPGVPSLIDLGNFLVEHGFSVGEHVKFGGICTNQCHVSGSYHYRFGGQGAIDVNIGPAGASSFEQSKINAIVRPVQELGFRTIWLTTGHYDHIHIDIANSTSLGLGGPAGLLGLEEAILDVHLVSEDDAGDDDFGPYAIPTYIVLCESGGNYRAVNEESGAGGAYQILPSTWRDYGGTGLPQDAPPEVQDEIARRIWETQGPDAWVCA